MPEFLLHGNAELLLLVNDEQSKVLELHILAREFMCAYYNIYLALLDLLEHLLCRCGTACAAQVFNGAGELLQALLEREVVLVCEYGRGYKHCHLLAVCGGLEGGAYRDLGLAEAHITAYQTVHRTLALHVPLYLVGSFQLVGCVLIDEACLELVLQVTVGRECEALLLVAF